MNGCALRYRAPDPYAGPGGILTVTAAHGQPNAEFVADVAANLAAILSEPSGLVITTPAGRDHPRARHIWLTRRPQISAAPVEATDPQPATAPQAAPKRPWYQAVAWHNGDLISLGMGSDQDELRARGYRVLQTMGIEKRTAVQIAVYHHH